MKNVGFLSALCCGIFLSSGAALAQAVPDCDCDGIPDATETATCMTACCAAVQGGCIVTPPNSAQTQCSALCAKLDCNTDLTAGKCCNPATGVETTLCDGVNCTNDTCSTETKNNTAKDCAVATGHGTPVHTADNGFCNQNADGWTCGGPSGAACGDKDVVCASKCSLNGNACSPTTLCTKVCAVAHTKCKDNSDCPNSEACVPQTCDTPICQDNDECDFYICNPGAFADGNGCDQKFAAAGTLCPKTGSSVNDICTDPDTCDGKGTCKPNNALDGTVCEDDYACRTSTITCDPALSGGTGNCVTKRCSNNLFGAACTVANDCRVCNLSGAGCSGGSCSKVCAKDPRQSCTGAPGDCNGGNLGACTSQTCGGTATCDKDACIPRICTDNKCATGLCVASAHVGSCESDGNLCTTDACNTSNCAHTNNTVACNDNDKCTSGDACSGGACVGTAVSCDDGNCCTPGDICSQFDNRANTKGCVITYASSPCGALLCQTRITFASTGSTRAVSDFPTDDDVTLGDEPGGSVLEKSCYDVELWCIDGSVPQLGIACVFADLALIGNACPSVFEDRNGNGVAINVNSTFGVNPSGSLSFDGYLADEVGGCANVGGVGVEQWVKVGYVETAAAQDNCVGSADIGAAATGSSLFGDGAVAISTGPFGCGANPFLDPNPYKVLCWGNLYDDSYNTFVGVEDWAQFAPCWLKTVAAVPACVEFDYNKDGTVNGADFSMFAAAWLKSWCGGGMAVPCTQLGGCSCSQPMNAVVTYDDGSTEEIVIPLPTRDQIESAGLVYPERDPELWQVQPDEVKSRLVRPSANPKLRGTR